MKIVFFVHSVVSDWNNGHAHFQRGLISALSRMGHQVISCEKWRNWSADNLYNNNGAGPFIEWAKKFPDIWVEMYSGGENILEETDRLTRDADLVIVHEFNEPELVGAVGQIRRNRKDFVLLFHDTHHRLVSVPYQIDRFNLAGYDGFLVFGKSLADVYKTRYGLEKLWIFHEAADTDTFQPLNREKKRDVVWIGNWGDDERTSEIRDYLIEPALCMKDLKFSVFGVRYPKTAVKELVSSGIEYHMGVPNFHVPEVYAESKISIHIPRKFYRDMLPGIATIRPFEALACGIPLISADWKDTEGLFRAGEDYVSVKNPAEMCESIKRLCHDPEECDRLRQNGLERIMANHTCNHRAVQLIDIYNSIEREGA